MTEILHTCLDCNGKKRILTDENDRMLFEALEHTPRFMQSQFNKSAIDKAKEAIKESTEDCGTCEGTGEVSELHHKMLIAVHKADEL